MLRIHSYNSLGRYSLVLHALSIHCCNRQGLAWHMGNGRWSTWGRHILCCQGSVRKPHRQDWRRRFRVAVLYLLWHGDLQLLLISGRVRRSRDLSQIHKIKASRGGIWYTSCLKHSTKCIIRILGASESGGNLVGSKEIFSVLGDDEMGKY